MFFYDAFEWNWSKIASNDDGIFVASCLNEVISYEIEWPNAYEKEVLGDMLLGLEDIVGNIDGTLCQDTEGPIEM